MSFNDKIKNNMSVKNRFDKHNKDFMFLILIHYILKIHDVNVKKIQKNKIYFRNN